MFYLSSDFNILCFIIIDKIYLFTLILFSMLYIINITACVYASVCTYSQIFNNFHSFYYQNVFQHYLMNRNSAFI